MELFFYYSIIHNMVTKFFRTSSHCFIITKAINKVLKGTFLLPIIIDYTCHLKSGPE